MRGFDVSEVRFTGSTLTGSAGRFTDGFTDGITDGPIDSPSDGLSYGLSNGPTDGLSYGLSNGPDLASNSMTSASAATSDSVLASGSDSVISVDFELDAGSDADPDPLLIN